MSERLILARSYYAAGRLSSVRDLAAYDNTLMSVVTSRWTELQQSGHQDDLCSTGFLTQDVAMKWSDTCTIHRRLES
jgi:hypothetical protein